MKSARSGSPWAQKNGHLARFACGGPSPPGFTSLLFLLCSSPFARKGANVVQALEQIQAGGGELVAFAAVLHQIHGAQLFQAGVQGLAAAGRFARGRRARPTAREWRSGSPARPTVVEQQRCLCSSCGGLSGRTGLHPRRSDNDYTPKRSNAIALIAASGLTRSGVPQAQRLPRRAKTRVVAKTLRLSMWRQKHAGRR
jgi:hypothetical protein